jgi:hypothetical protein
MMLWPGRRPARGLLLLLVVLICQQGLSPPLAVVRAPDV